MDTESKVNKNLNYELDIIFVNLKYILHLHYNPCTIVSDCNSNIPCY